MHCATSPGLAYLKNVYQKCQFILELLHIKYQITHMLYVRTLDASIGRIISFLVVFFTRFLLTLSTQTYSIY